jgi:hypothetical protein
MEALAEGFLPFCWERPWLPGAGEGLGLVEGGRRVAMWVKIDVYEGGLVSSRKMKVWS